MMLKKTNKILLFSPSFYGGGAERVLSQLYNHDPNTYECACFKHNNKDNTYLSCDPPKSNCLESISDANKLSVSGLKRKNIKSFFKLKFPNSSKRIDSLIKIILRISFLHSLLSRYGSIIVCDYSTVYLLLVAVFFSHHNPLIIFRPSIDLDYINKIFFSNNILQKLLNGFGLYLLRSYKNKRYVFQTLKIKYSFEVNTLLSNSDGYLLLNNPLSQDRAFPQHTAMYSGNMLLNFTYIGRATYDKGFDRYTAMSQNNNLSNHKFHYYGPSSIDTWENNNILDHGWSDPSNISYQNHILIIPSRVEGYPNILVEALSSGILVFCSNDVYNLLELYAQHLLPYINILDDFYDINDRFFYDSIRRRTGPSLEKQIQVIKNLHCLQYYSDSVKRISLS